FQLHSQSVPTCNDSLFPSLLCCKARGACSIHPYRLGKAVPASLPTSRRRNSRASPRGAGGSEGEAENVIKLDPGKGKSGSLRERLMQIPLCEKALAFKIHPGPKESLLSLGQFNCCHVI
uniref:Uncharacterized protein n=1 Tax=Meleagris gallopavo TaxID=9103 RepID=A0A803YM37_MELGA